MAVQPTVRPTAPGAPRIRRAGPEDRQWVRELVGRAFMEDPVSCWVFPEEAHRRSVHPGFFGVFLDIALSEGFVDVTEDGAAAAIWVPVGSPEGSAQAADVEAVEDDTAARLRAADPDNERTEIVGRMTGERHPEDRFHYYLMIIGVERERRGGGLGSALLAPVLERCDSEGIPAYLEASNERSRALYLRHGFTDHGEAIQLPGGPLMWPMWREPLARS